MIEITAALLLVAVFVGLAIVAGLKTRLTQPSVVLYVDGQLPEVWGSAAGYVERDPNRGPDLVQEQMLDPMYWRGVPVVMGDPTGTDPIGADPMGHHY